MMDFSENEGNSRDNNKCKDTLNHGSDGGVDGGVNSDDFDFNNIDEGQVRQLIFESIGDAERFYSSYAKVAGFEIRKQTVKRTSADLVKYREWVCSCEGFRRRPTDDYSRKREPKALTRCGCTAGFRVVHDSVSGHYIVTRFESKHNHDLQGFRKRYISMPDKCILNLMTDLGFRPCLVMDLLKHLAGGVGKISFTRKDGYNWLSKVRLERVQRGDINTLLALFESMKAKDDDFFYKYEVDEEDALTRIFWCDGASRAEYELFGDVLLFDSTYKTNKYLYPLVLFSGVNNHGSTFIFGASFLRNETISSYQWLLEAFLEAMNNKIPGSVLTDQDSSMVAAIFSKFPGTRHRLCGWHLGRNVRQNIKVPRFCSDFSRLLREPCSIEEFEIRWKNIVQLHEVANKQWVKDIYGKKKMWAEAYFRGQFMAMTWTTQRAESMNSLIKLAANQKMTITEFVKHYNCTLQNLRGGFLTDQVETETTRQAVRESPLKRLEEHAASICTKKIFDVIRDEIRAEQGLILESKEEIDEEHYEFVFENYDDHEGAQHTVIIDKYNDNFKCDCLMLESEGVPCRHIISAFKSMRIKEFPQNSIHRRWLIQTGRMLKNKYPEAIPVVGAQQTRFAQLNKEVLNLSYISSQTESGYIESLKQVRKFSKEATKEFLKHNDSGNHMSGNGVVDDSKLYSEPVGDPPIGTNVNDPVRIKTRGAKRAKQHNCGFCREPGHKATTCSRNPANSARRTHARAKNSRNATEGSSSQYDCSQNSIGSSR